jgi:hypothetical protein
MLKTKRLNTGYQPAVETENITDRGSNLYRYRILVDGSHIGFISKLRDTPGTINPYMLWANNRGQFGDRLDVVYGSLDRATARLITIAK